MSKKVVDRLVNFIGRSDLSTYALAKILAQEGVRTRADLKKNNVISRLPLESRANILFNPSRSISLTTAQNIIAYVKKHLMFSSQLKPLEIISVGSVRRCKENVSDIDFLIVSDKIENVLDSITLPSGKISIVNTYAAGVRRRSCILQDSFGKNYRSDFFITTTKEKPFALFHYTGSHNYNIRIRAHAKQNGWLLNQYGLFNAVTRHRVRGSSMIHNESDLSKFLGITYRQPNNRT